MKSVSIMLKKLQLWLLMSYICKSSPCSRISPHARLLRYCAVTSWRVFVRVYEFVCVCFWAPARFLILLTLRDMFPHSWIGKPNRNLLDEMTLINVLKTAHTASLCKYKRTTAGTLILMWKPQLRLQLAAENVSAAARFEQNCWFYLIHLHLWALLNILLSVCLFYPCMLQESAASALTLRSFLQQLRATHHHRVDVNICCSHSWQLSPSAERISDKQHPYLMVFCFFSFLKLSELFWCLITSDLPSFLQDI